MWKFTRLTFCLAILSILIPCQTYSQEAPFDCISARVLTSKAQVTVSGTEIGSLGAFNEAGSCFQDVERSPYWFSFEVCQSGSLIAYIDPEGTSDFDFVLYDITNGCGAKSEVTCNFQSSVGANNITGIGCNNGSSCNLPVNVTAGRTYAIMFSRYTPGSTAGFTLTIDGTFEISNPNELDFQPKINKTSSVCGLSTPVSANVNPLSDSFLWTGSGPGNIAFTDPTNPVTTASVDLPGFYTIYFAASKQVCSNSLSLVDSIIVEFQAKTKLFGDSSIQVCESNTDVLLLNQFLTGTPPVNGFWTDLNNSGAIDQSGNFNGYGLGGNVYSYKYTVTPTTQCFDSTATLTVSISSKLQVTIDSIRCFNSGADYRVFSKLSGGKPSTYAVNTLPFTGPLYSSGFISNQSAYSFVYTDSSGCPSTAIKGVFDCACGTAASNLLSETNYDCSNQTVAIQTSSAPKLNSGEVQTFILFSNPNDPKGTIVFQNSTPSFTFQSPLLVNTTYYIAAIAGNDDGNNNVDLTDACLNISSPIEFSFPDQGEVSMILDTLICEGGTASLAFNLSGTSNAMIEVSANAVLSTHFLKPGITNLLVSPTTTTTYTIVSSKNNVGCEINSTSNAQVTVNIKPTFNYSLVNNASVCASLNEGNPVLIFDTDGNENLTIKHQINGISQPDLTDVVDNQLFNLPLVVIGKNTFTASSIHSTITGCDFQVNPIEINYFNLAKPNTTVLADKVELCSLPSETKVTYSVGSNLPMNLYYNINNVRLSTLVNGSSEIGYPVTTNLTFNLDSVSYADFPTCKYSVSGTTAVKLYTAPDLSIQTSAITCTDTLGKIEINSPIKTALYSVDGSSFSTDTIFNIENPGPQQLTVKLGATCIYTYPFTIDYIKPFDLVTTATHSKCDQANGSFTPEITGDFVAPITYSFNGQPSNTNLRSGTYQITATDALGCKVSIVDVINPSTPFLFNATTLDTVKCAFGILGSVALKASGGDGSVFTYSFDGISFGPVDTLKNLRPKFYTFYARNEVGCLDSVRVKIKSDSLLQIGLTALNYLKCFESTDASFKVNVLNSTDDLIYSTNGYTYSSSNVFSNVGPGQITFYAKETIGCEREQTVNFVVTRPAKLNLNLVSKGNPACFNINNGFLSVQGQGSSSSYSYSINSGNSFQTSGVFTGLAPGTYSTYAVNGQGCSTDTLAIELIAPPAIVINSIDMVLNPDLTTGNITIHATGGVPGFTYSITGGLYYSDSVFNNVPKGTYTAYVKDSKGCIETQSILVGTVGIENKTSTATAILAYPNPFNQSLNIEVGTTETTQVLITNLLGQQFMKKTISGKAVINTTDWSPGIYLITFENSSGKITQKIIKH